MEPGKTSFFQALGVPTKIARGTIEITTDLKLVEAGSKVGASEATLLNMLNISPFTYGMSIAQVYDGGQTFAPSVLDIKEEQLFKALNSAIATITQISLAANYPTLPSIMHSLMNSYKNVLAVAVETDYSWEGISELKDRIANPDAYAAAAPAETAEPEPDKSADDEGEKSDKGDDSSDSEGGIVSRPTSKFHLLTSVQDSGVSLTRSCCNVYIAAKRQSIHYGFSELCTKLFTCMNLLTPVSCIKVSTPQHDSVQRDSIAQLIVSPTPSYHTLPFGERLVTF